MFSNSILQTDVALQSFNTFGIAASARFYIRVTQIEQLQLLDQWPEIAGLPRLILGGGSNVIFTHDFPGVVVHIVLAGRERVSEDEQFTYVRAAAGEGWHDFVQWTLTQGWGGLENLSLIPGSVGAAPIQNIGAYGVEFKDFFHSLSWYEYATGKIHCLTARDCQFSYRDSVFKHALRDQGVIVNVTFALPKRWHARLAYGDVANALQAFSSPTPVQISQVICAIRQSKLPDPKQIGNVGSFFKNPVVGAALRLALLTRFPDLVSFPQTDGQFKLAAGWLIERAGWKGRVCGQAGVYEKQALVIVNLGGASGQQVVQLAQSIQLDVELQFGVKLDVEPVLI
jgi:UDP-N-acetylmuramate dehydrogenase